MILETINKLLCAKRQTSFILFDKNLKLLEYSFLNDDIVDEQRSLTYGEDIRESIWLFTGLEEDMMQLFEDEEKTIHIPMIIKNDHYYDLDIETLTTEDDEKLFIAYFIQKSKKSIEYIEMIKKINKKTLIYETSKEKQEQHAINERLITFHVDLEGTITQVSDTLLHFLNIEKDKIVGSHFSGFFQSRTFDIQSQNNSILSAKNAMGERVFFNATIVPLSQNGKVYENIIICQDISYLQTAQKNLEYVSELDTLTGLLNKTALLESIDSAIQKGKAFTLALINIQHFCDLNENYGYHAGDMLLKHVATLLKNTIRQEDTLARVSTDHFMILFDADAQEIRTTLKRIYQLPKQNPLLYSHDDSLHFTFEMVWVSYPHDAKSAKDLFDLSEKKLQEIKKKRKN